MHPKFVAATASLHGLFNKLNSTEPLDRSYKWPRERLRGVYLFSENGVPLYVGRTNDAKGRYGRHCRPGATWRMAAFAFRLARESTNRAHATYRAGEGSRQALAADPTFAAAFDEANAICHSTEPDRSRGRAAC